MRRKVLWVRVVKKRGVGRPRGSPTAQHRRPAVMASVKAVIEEVVSERQPSIKRAIIEGIDSGPRDSERFLRLCAEYTDGKPDATLNLRTQFKEDEVVSAQRSLERKMNRLFERTMALESGVIDVTPDREKERA